MRREFSLCVCLIAALAASHGSAATILFQSGFDNNQGATVLPGNADNVSGSPALTITDWATDASVMSVSGLTAISTGDSGTLGGFAQLQGGTATYANDDVVFLSRNHNQDTDRTTSRRGFSLDFTLATPQSLGTLTVLSGHTNAAGTQDQSYVSDLVFELSGGNLPTSITQSTTIDYSTGPAYRTVNFNLTGTTLDPADYTLAIYQTNMTGGGAYATYDRITLATKAESAPGTTALIDFGRSENPSSAAYNSIDFIGPNGSNITTGSVALTDTGGAPTGWSIVVTEDGSGNGGGAGTSADISAVPAAISAFETTAYEDSLFANGTSASMTVSLTGLDDSLNYDLLFYGSRANGQSIPDQTWHLIEGTGGADVVHASGLNTTTVVEWNDISTNGSGEIAFTIKGTSSGALALNFGSISAVSAVAAVPEPSTFALAALGLLGLGLVGWRRRSK